MDERKEFDELLRLWRLVRGTEDDKHTAIDGINTDSCKENEQDKYFPSWAVLLKIRAALNLSVAEMEDIIGRHSQE